MKPNTARPKFDKLVKLVLIGDSHVGKTSLILRFAENKFVEDHMTTLGIDFKVKMIAQNEKTIKV
jgi:GTPase SAR1 family protein